MSLVDQIADFYRDTRVRIEVPEWEGTALPSVLYARPYTIADDRKMARYVRDDDPKGFAALVVAKAEDENGQRLFADLDHVKLARACPAHIIKRIAGQIVSSAPSVEDAEGN